MLASVAYAYDAFGRLVQRTATVGGTTTVQRYGYDAAGNVWADLDGSNNLVTRRLYGDSVDQPVARIDGNGVAWYHADLRGSVVALTDGAGVLRELKGYDAYGNVVSDSNPAFGDRYGYTGTWTDPLTGLQYNRARWYDPTTGRFTSEDPLGFAAGDLDVYRYVQNSPTNYTDPSGLLRYVSQPGGVTAVLDDQGRYIGTLIRVGGVPYVRRNGLAAPLDRVGQQGGLFGPGSTDDWAKWIKENGIVPPNPNLRRSNGENPDLDAVNDAIDRNGGRLIPGCIGTGNGQGYYEAGLDARLAIIAMGISVGREFAEQLAARIGGHLVGKFMGFLAKKGWTLVKGIGILSKEGKAISKEALKDLEKEFVAGEKAAAKQCEKAVAKASRLARGKGAFDRAVKELGIDKNRASKALHKAKKLAGRGGVDNIVIDLDTGNIIAPETGEIIGSLFD